MPHSAIGPIAIHLPQRVEDIDQLAAEFPRWDIPTIYAKTGIRAAHCRPRRVRFGLGRGGGGKALSRPRDRPQFDRFPVVLHPNARLRLADDRLPHARPAGSAHLDGRLDFNLGCSGFVYGLALADGMIRSGLARRVLLITAETYSKYIDPVDRSLRTIFGDGAAATLVEASEAPSIGSFVLGTDGRGANSLMVIGQGAATPQAIQPSKRKRWPSSLYMDGPELVKFTLEVIPPMVERLLCRSGWTRETLDFYLMHQATAFMLDHIRERMKLAGKNARSARNDRQHRLLDDSDPHRRPAHRGPAQARREIAPHRLRRGPLRGGCAWTETWAGK